MRAGDTKGWVTSVGRSGSHDFSKPPCARIRLIEGLGVEGDAHLGATVQHRSHVAKDASRPNLRQVHLLHAELFDELREKGFDVTAGAIGENVTTSGVDLLRLPKGTRLHLGDAAIVEVTGLRHPCRQLDAFQAGLMEAVLERDENGALIRKAGIMAVILRGGAVRSGDAIHFEWPPEPHEKMGPV